MKAPQVKLKRFNKIENATISDSQCTTQILFLCMVQSPVNKFISCWSSFTLEYTSKWSFRKVIYWSVGYCNCSAANRWRDGVVVWIKLKVEKKKGREIFASPIHGLVIPPLLNSILVNYSPKCWRIFADKRSEMFVRHLKLLQQRKIGVKRNATEGGRVGWG